MYLLANLGMYYIGSYLGKVGVAQVKLQFFLKYGLGLHEKHLCPLCQIGEQKKDNALWSIEDVATNGGPSRQCAAEVLFMRQLVISVANVCTVSFCNFDGCVSLGTGD